MREQSLCQERIVSQEYRDFIIGNKIPPSIENIAKEQICEQKIVYDYTCVYIEDYIASDINISQFYYNTIPSCYGLLDMEAMEDAGIIATQNYPTLQLKGENVMVGIIDTGIDYTNDVFRDIVGNTRIISIWDQSIQEGEPPEGFEYGSEYKRDLINQALQLEDPYQLVPTKDTVGHGTFTASVAAGSVNLEEDFIGAAPESTIAVVKLKEAKQYLKDFYYIKDDVPAYQENDIMFAVRYLVELAKKEEMPLALCIALGSNLGSHTGISPLGNILNQYSDVPGLAIVTGVGNEANERHHFLGNASKVTNKQSKQTEVEVRVGSDVKGFVMEMWTEFPNIYRITVVSPSGEKVPPTPIRKGSDGEYYFLFEKTKVYIDYRLLMERSNSELIFFQFTNPTAGIWKIIVEEVQSVDGIFHMWITDEKFLTGEVYFLESEPDETINEPSNAMFPITVAYYDGAQNTLDINSGRGYTRTSKIKPDFTAPGVNVKGVLPRNRYTQRSGSSIATAITVGACALLLEWNVYQLGQKNVSSIQIKNLLILGARQMEGVSYPNPRWGYGMLDIYNTFQAIRRI